MARFVQVLAGVDRRVGPASTPTPRADPNPLLWLAGSLAAAGGVLAFTAGPPRLPAEAPNPDLLLAGLRGSSLPLDVAAYALTSVAWLIWAWLCASVLLRLALGAAEAATHGAGWVRSLRAVSDRVTVPVVRRAVDSALAMAMVVQVVAHAAPASAEPLADSSPDLAYVDTAAAPVANATPSRPAMAEAYTVQPGDTLYSIAERFYGTGEEFPRLVEANLNRPMRDGAVFSADGVIEPGWVLRVPLANTRLDVDENGQAWYTVERGDTLWGVSARFMGDPTRWPEVFGANQGASLDDDRALTNPNLIWPGLRLSMPVTLQADEAEDVPPEAAPPPPPETLAPADGAPLAQSDTVQPAPSTSTSVEPGSVLTAQTAGAAAATSAAAVAALLAVRRRGRRGLDEPPLGEEPESDIPVRTGFAELRDLSREGDHRTVEAAAAEVLRFLDAHELRGRVGVISARHGRSSTTLALVCQRLADRPRLLQLASAIERRLGVPVQARLSRDHDTLLRLGTLRHARFDDLSSTGTSAPCVLLPAGVLPDRRVLYVNWPALGHVLIAGRAAAAVSDVLSTLLASLATRFEPSALQVLSIARPAAIGEPLVRLPHQVGHPIDPDDHVATGAALHDARAELLRRMERVERGGSVSTFPEVLIVVPELRDLAEHASTLDLFGVYGPAHRVRLLAASTHPEALSDSLLAHFATRAVLRLPDDVQGTRLLGHTGAADDLLGGGQLLLRLDAREPLEVYAFRAPDSELDRLVRTLRGEPVPVRVDPTALPPMDDAEPSVEELFAGDGAPGHRPEVLDFGQRTPPPITLRCLGGFDVLDGPHDLTGAGSPAEAAQHAPAWELLAYLGSHAEGVVSRDDLIQAVWPEADPRAATTYLAGALDRLNVLLARPLLADEQVPVVRVDERDDTVRLDLERVESDVHRFLRLCQAAPMMPAEQARGALTRARELYRGDLLDGPGARAYAWAVQPPEDGELSLRERYREQYLRATLRLARLLARAGEQAAAIPLFQSLLEVEPLLEDVVRDVCRCYAALGDRQAVLDQERRLRAALRDAYVTYGGPNDDGPDPEPATSALLAELLEDLEVRGRAVLA